MLQGQYLANHRGYKATDQVALHLAINMRLKLGLEELIEGNIARGREIGVGQGERDKAWGHSQGDRGQKTQG